jgi:uncharacterized OB-fold protein
MPILDRLDHLHRAKAIEDDLPFHSLYTVGIAGERFFRALKDEGKILGTHCTACDVMYVPGRLYCERCFTHLDDDSWFDAGTLGTVHTFTVIHIGLDGTRLEAPRIMAFIEVGDTDGGLVHYLGEIDPESVFIGLTVEAVFKPSNARTGSITDILYFKPIE